MQVATGSKRALVLLLACVTSCHVCVSGLRDGGSSSSALPAELSAWRRLEHQRTGRLSALLRDLSAAASGPSAASVSSKLAWYVSSQRPLFAAQDMKQLLNANRQAAAAASAALPDGGLLYVGHDLYDFNSGRSSSDDEAGDSWLPMVGPDGEPPVLLHTLPGSEAYQDYFTSSSSSDDEDFEGFVDAHALEQPAASRRMLLNTAASSSSSSSASETPVFNIPGLSGMIGSNGAWSTVSELASSLRDSQRVQAAAADAAAAVVPARAGQIPRQQDFRIIGGAEAPRDRYDWMCSLRGANDFHFCGCSLIAPNVVISAAHCVDHDDTVLSRPWVEVGRYYLAGDNTTYNSYDRIRCTKSVMHPGWSSKHGRNDISLCFLASESRFEPVTLADGQTPEPGTSVVVMGWGSQREGATNADTLMEVTVEVTSTGACNQTYKGNLRATQLCAGVPQGGADACQGDSGGPLILLGDTPADDMQVGIVSYGVGCGRPNIPGVYTDVSQYRDFIAQTLVANGVDYEPLTGSLTATPSLASQGANPDATPSPANTDTNTSSSSNDPCACSADGYSGDKFVGLALTGCKQHGLDFGDSSFYCYAQAGTACSTATVSSAYPGAAWLNCTPSVEATPAASEMSITDSSASGVVPGPSLGVAGALNALQSWDWMFNTANNGSSSGSDNGTNSSPAGTGQAEQPAAVAVARAP